MGTLTGKSLELAKIFEKRKVNIACVQETRNRVGILVDNDLRAIVVEVRRVNDRLLTIKLVVGGFTLNIISVYAPQAELDEEVKMSFWADLDEMVWGTPYTEKVLIGGDFNGHIVATSGRYDVVRVGFGFGETEEEPNSSFPKKREHLVTFRSSVAETQIDYVLCRKYNRGLCTNCKVIPSENLSTLHRLLVMEFEITRKRAIYSQHRIKWGALMEAKAQELGVKLVTMGA
uniref:Craniofacial development protein 2-like n=1 Tax=Nicotiana tabacum TaxID=4097 RepID=A0A1S4BLV7_TOBAC|nr:PREDICTED: craniofacial development protein 2-like [Nicotiana tabacum]